MTVAHLTNPDPENPMLQRKATIAEGSDDTADIKHDVVFTITPNSVFVSVVRQRLGWPKQVCS